MSEAARAMKMAEELCRECSLIPLQYRAQIAAKMIVYAAEQTAALRALVERLRERLPKEHALECRARAGNWLAAMEERPPLPCCCGLDALLHEPEGQRAAEAHQQPAGAFCTNCGASSVVNPGPSEEALRDLLKHSLEHARQYDNGCLWCGEGEIVDGTTTDEHQATCWWYRARAVLRTA